MVTVAGRIARLAPTVDIDGPRVRLGLAWAAVTLIALFISTALLALWMAVVGAAAGWQACATWRRTRDRPRRAVAIGGAAAVPIAALAGPLGVGAAAAVVAIVSVAVLGDDRRRLATTVAVALALGAAGAAPVVVAVEWTPAASGVLLLSVFVYDASAYVVGSGTVHRWEGVAAGIASVASLTLAVAAGLIPPFRGVAPWVLGAFVAALAPLGPLFATALLGPVPAPVAALRRLDSLLLAGPAWAAAAAILLRT